MVKKTEITGIKNWCDDDNNIIQSDEDLIGTVEIDTDEMPDEVVIDGFVYRVVV